MSRTASGLDKKDWQGLEEDALARFTRVASIGLDSDAEVIPLGRRRSRPYLTPTLQARSDGSDVRLDLLTNTIVYNLVGISFKNPLPAMLFYPLCGILERHQGAGDIDPRFPALHDFGEAYRAGRTVTAVGLAIDRDLETTIAVRYLHHASSYAKLLSLSESEQIKNLCKTHAQNEALNPLEAALLSLYRTQAVLPVTARWEAQEKAVTSERKTLLSRPDALH